MTTTDVRKLKIEVKDAILECIRRDGAAKKDVLVASLGLNTGLSRKVIYGIVEDMTLSRLIKEENDELKLVGVD